MSRMLHSRYVIIGSGAAGIAAAETIRQNDAAGSIAVISDEPHEHYSRPGLAYALTGVIPEEQLFPLGAEDWTRLNVNLIHTRVTSIDAQDRQIEIDQGQHLEYESLLIATGARAHLPRIEGIDHEGIVTFDTLNDTRHMIRLARRARRAIVIGGGITALEIAEGLSARGVETHYFLRKDRYWNRVLDRHESQLVEEKLTEEGIVIHRNTNLGSILSRRGRLTGVVTEQGQQLKCQIMAFAIGIRPNIELAQAAGLQVDRGILVDEGQRTSAAGIFAAGDVAQVFDPITGKHILDSLWWLAQEQGRVAGTNMAGGSQSYTRTIPFNVTRIGGIVTTIIGRVGQVENNPRQAVIMHGDSEYWQERLDSFAVETKKKDNHLRLMIGPETIRGAVIMGDQTLSRPIQALINAGADIRPIRDALIRSPERAPELITAYLKKYPLQPSRMVA
jgi:NAD(P)H-nitrite reductase large subunit